MNMCKIVFFRIEFKDDTGESVINGLVKELQSDEQVIRAERVNIG